MKPSDESPWRYMVMSIVSFMLGLWGSIALYHDESFSFAWGSVFEGGFLLVVVFCFFLTSILSMLVFAQSLNKHDDDYR